MYNLVLNYTVGFLINPFSLSKTYHGIFSLHNENNVRAEHVVNDATCTLFSLHFNPRQGPKKCPCTKEPRAETLALYESTFGHRSGIGRAYNPDTRAPLWTAIQASPHSWFQNH